MPIHKEQRIIAAAKEHGASLAGIARVANDRESPSLLAFVRMGDYTGAGHTPGRQPQTNSAGCEPCLARRSTVLGRSR
ncbi:MAG: hypothetical protein ACLFT5_09800 [Desulfovermiculus sp.]